jgi:hypothetical protein
MCGITYLMSIPVAAADETGLTMKVGQATALVAARCQGRPVLEFSVGRRGRLGRADVADIQLNSLDGYEIKTAGDSLGRLPSQVQVYSLIFDRCWAVVAPNHLDRTMATVPGWWGVQVLDGQLQPVRPAQPAPCGSCRLLLGLLWKPEIMELLRRLGEQPDRNSTVISLYRQLASALGVSYSPRVQTTQPDLHDLRAVVRWALLRRQTELDRRHPEQARWPGNTRVLAPWPFRPVPAGTAT